MAGEVDEAWLAEIEARANAATKGPWYVEGRGGLHMDGTRDGYDVAIPEPPYRLHNPWWTLPNAEFAAHARADVPDLVAALRASRAEADLLRGLLREARVFVRYWSTLQDDAHGVPLRDRIDAAIGGASGE